MKRWSLYNPFSLDLFAHPEISTHKDGSLIIELKAITPEYINGLIENIEAAGKLNIDDLFRLIDSDGDDYEKGRTTAANAFGIEESVIDFVYNMATCEVLKFMGDEKKHQKVVAKWKAIRELVSENNCVQILS